MTVQSLLSCSDLTRLNSSQISRSQIANPAVRRDKTTGQSAEADEICANPKNCQRFRTYPYPFPSTVAHSSLTVPCAPKMSSSTHAKRVLVLIASQGCGEYIPATDTMAPDGLTRAKWESRPGVCPFAVDPTSTQVLTQAIRLHELQLRTFNL
jgi:hypothetical protein